MFGLPSSCAEVSQNGLLNGCVELRQDYGNPGLLGWWADGDDFRLDILGGHCPHKVFREQSLVHGNRTR